jgi:hypothetical protein
MYANSYNMYLYPLILTTSQDAYLYSTVYIIPLHAGHIARHLFCCYTHTYWSLLEMLTFTVCNYNKYAGHFTRCFLLQGVNIAKHTSHLTRCFLLQYVKISTQNGHLTRVFSFIICKYTHTYWFPHEMLSFTVCK